MTTVSLSNFDIAQDLGQGRSYFIKTYGCAANERDSEIIAGILQMMGFSPAQSELDASLILLNTCAIRQNAEDKVFGSIREHLKQLKRTSDELVFGVCGCMAQEEVSVDLILKKYPQVDLVFGTHNIHRLPYLLANAYLKKKKQWKF